MSEFQFSASSLDHLRTVNQSLASVVFRALQLTPDDFSVIDGLRTKEQQEEYVRKGVSRTLDSAHLRGNAIDIAVWHKGRICWEWEAYQGVADAMKQAAIERNVGIQWGCIWDMPDCRKSEKTSLIVEASRYYHDRLRAGKEPFMDSPHWQLTSDPTS